MTVYGRQETWDDSPAGWPQHAGNPHRWEITGEQVRTNGRPTAQWSRLEAGRSDDLGAAERWLSRACDGASHCWSSFVTSLRFQGSS